jgi:hypothetical protein
VKRCRRAPALAWILFLLLVGARVYSSEWDFTRAGDPNRNWGVTVSTAGEYDDNWLSTEKARESGLREVSDIKFRASIPFQRLFVGIQYD